MEGGLWITGISLPAIDKARDDAPIGARLGCSARVERMWNIGVTAKGW